MAVLYITEFASLAPQPPGATGQVAQQPPIAEQTVALTSTSAQSAAFNANTRFVRLHTDVICAIEFGTNPTAVANGGSGPTARMAANQTEYFGVPIGIGSSYKVAGVTST
jgi:hypothetical protein